MIEIIAVRKATKKEIKNFEKKTAHKRGGDRIAECKTN